jgi:hypothetical protein
MWLAQYFKLVVISNTGDISKAGMSRMSTVSAAWVVFVAMSEGLSKRQHVTQ